MELTLLTILAMIAAVGCDLYIDKSDWVDPGDMLRYDSGTKKMKPLIKRPPTVSPSKATRAQIKTMEQEVEASTEEEINLSLEPLPVVQEVDTCQNIETQTASPDCSQCELVFLRRFIRRLLTQIKYAMDSEDAVNLQEYLFDARLYITPESIALLNRFVSNDMRTKPSLADIGDVLSHLIRAIKPEEKKEVVQIDYGNYLWEKVLENHMLLAFILLIFAVRYMAVRLNTFGIFLLFSFVLFWLSVAWEWIHLYQKAQSEAISERAKFGGEIPKECNPSGLSTWTWIGLGIADFFGRENQCKKYYESFLVETKYSVSPMTAFASILGKVGEAISLSTGKSIGLLYGGVMQQFGFFWQIVMFIALTLIIIATIAFVIPALIRSFPTVMVQAMGTQSFRRMIEEQPLTANVQQRSLPADVPVAETSVCDHCHQRTEPEVLHSQLILPRHHSQHQHNHLINHSCADLGDCGGHCRQGKESRVSCAEHGQQQSVHACLSRCKVHTNCQDLTPNCNHRHCSCQCHNCHQENYANVACENDDLPKDLLPDSKETTEQVHETEP